MNRIILIGSGGAGKSTLARQLAQTLELPMYHLDALFWKPNWQPVDKEEQIKVQHDLTKQPKWIIDGNYGSTVDIRLQAADTVIFLDMPRTLCLYRAIKRRIQYRRTSRPDMGAGCSEKLDIAFLRWIWNFPKQKSPELYQKINRFAHEKQVIILKSPKQVQQFLKQVSSSK